MSPQWLRAGQAFDRLPVGKENSLPHCWVHTSQAWGSHNSPHEGAIWTKASSGVGEVFYNAVQQFRDLGLALKFFAPVNPCAQQRDPLLDWKNLKCFGSSGEDKNWAGESGWDRSERQLRTVVIDSEDTIHLNYSVCKDCLPFHLHRGIQYIQE